MSYDFPDVYVKQLTEFSMFGQVKDWRFFMWLDKCLDMVEEIWMINVLIMGNVTVCSVSRELRLMLLLGLRMQHPIDVWRSWPPKI